MGATVPQQGTFPGPLHGPIAPVVLALLLVTVCAWDLRARRIPNWLVLVILVSGLAYATFGGGAAGLARAAAGVGIGLILWLPFYFFRMMGAGDVKFFAAACAWLGPSAALRAALLSAVFGGVLAVVWIAGSAVKQRAHHASPSTAAGGSEFGVSLRSSDSRSRKLPYGLAMAAGLAVAVWFPAFLP